MSDESILIVDDEKNILSTISMALKSNGYAVRTAESGAKALDEQAASECSLAVFDIMMPGMDGLELLRVFKEKWPNTAVIMMSGHGTISTAVEATKLGAYDFIEKPVSREKLLLTVKRAIEFRRLEKENIALRDEVRQKHDIIGESAAMKELVRRIMTVGNSQSRVMIRGENGVGKELVARALHNASPRRDRPFIKVNCAAIPHELIESELFGHEKGAFTGAAAMRRGKFEAANKGTIFLDEIGDMHLDTQAKVLRVLQEHEFHRVGGDNTVKVDVRVIAATNKDLEAEIKSNRFREDLYFRLNVIPIYVPPLRERRADIPLFARHFFRQFADEYGRPSKQLTESAVEALMDYSWPGNVRELQNFMERLFIMAEEPVIEAKTVYGHLPEGVAPDDWRSDAPLGSLKESMNLFEKEFIEKKLREHGFNISETARSLQLERSHLYKKIKAHGIRVP